MRGSRESKQTKRVSFRGSALEVAVGGIGAALYGAASVPTATILAMAISFPFGRVQLRPAIAIPMVIASVFGPWAGFICGAVGNTLQIFVFGYSPGVIPGFFANGLGAVVTAILAQTFVPRFAGSKRVFASIFAASLGLAWITGLIIGIGAFWLGFAVSIEAMLIFVLLVGIGNTIWACTIFPPAEVAVRRLVGRFSPGSPMEPKE